MQPDDLEALRRLVRADQEDAALSDYLNTSEREIREATPELEPAQAAGLISDAANERLAIFNLWLEVGGDQGSDIHFELDNLLLLLDRYLNRSIDLSETHFEYRELQNRVLSLLRQSTAVGWMSALREHNLLPPEL